MESVQWLANGSIVILEYVLIRLTAIVLIVMIPTCLHNLQKLYNTSFIDYIQLIGKYLIYRTLFWKWEMVSISAHNIFFPNSVFAMNETNFWYLHQTFTKRWLFLWQFIGKPRRRKFNPSNWIFRTKAFLTLKVKHFYTNGWKMHKKFFVYTFA